ncbi:YifB family Mg chelatase-like AAA ATPase [Campylobacter geochelonis]|uniref:Putative Mg chelatase-like protein n=1 Tax=Campylobacter geochelonis TaxID=1780362 RepID=A0A128ECN3_9BACT|nr:YifB family Mg chelatase-like AAA ATPase [Campylobacter geochelonis]QKF70518.1 magnesium chelatase-related protein [Campylobacter geochelonis]CZE46122.1 putative Mg chelatase-like protein [Campylobacter geochelonis]
MKSLNCATFTDVLRVVRVESIFMRGLPGFSIVGLANTTIKESESRVKAALLSLNFSFPPQKIVINLSPSDLPKSGSHFDLSIALLIALQKHEFDESFYVFAELGLNGEAKSTNSLFSILLFLSNKVKKAKVLVPKDIALKAAMIPNFEVYAISSLDEAIRFFIDEEFAKTCLVNATHPLFEKTIEIGGKNYVPNFNFELDFSDIKGQERAKRACLIAACGMHNIIFEGSPGCGKSMCAKRLRYILPPQSESEVMLAAAYESLNNKNVDFSALRAFRSPHHTSTRSSIFGGGSHTARIGEVALANGGELFFDEFPHFGKQILESLREPLEDNKILISRVNSKTEYETKFIFVAALNPCPCGNLFSKNGNCICSQVQINRYKSAISLPLLDRIDIYVAMDEVRQDDKSTLCSKDMYNDVLRVFTTQKERGQSELNGKLEGSEIERICVLSVQAKDVLNQAISRFNLSQRGINKTLKVARTIADLANSEMIEKAHILESLSFRVRSE